MDRTILAGIRGQTEENVAILVNLFHDTEPLKEQEVLSHLGLGSMPKWPDEYAQELRDLDAAICHLMDAVKDLDAILKASEERN